MYALNCGYVTSLKLQNLADVFPSKKIVNKPSIHYSELPEALKELQIHCIRVRSTWDVILCGFYTLLRPNEYCAMEWSWIDDDLTVITVPADVMKMKCSHTVPVSAQLKALLTNLPRVGKYVFPSTSGKDNTHFSTNAPGIFLRRHGFKDRLVPHGIRSIGRTWMHDHDIPFDVAEKCLHSIGTSTQLAYDRSDLLDKRGDAMQVWCDFVEECLK